MNKRKEVDLFLTNTLIDYNQFIFLSVIIKGVVEFISETTFLFLIA